METSMRVPALCFCGIRFWNHLWRIVRSRRTFLAAFVLTAATVSAIFGTSGQPNDIVSFIPNGFFFPNPNGASQSYCTINGDVDQTGPSSQSLGTNGRFGSSCHPPSDGRSVSAISVEL
jgi:hypothetical protein